MRVILVQCAVILEMCQKKNCVTNDENWGEEKII